MSDNGEKLDRGGEKKPGGGGVSGDKDEAQMAMWERSEKKH